MQRRFFALSLLAGGGLLTAGCGGGGGGDGALAPAPSPAPAAPAPDDPPTGTFAYVPRPDSRDVAVHQVLASGALRFVEATAAADGVSRVAVHASGRFAYALNSDALSVFVYDRNPANGLLNFKSSLTIPAFRMLTDFRFHPSGEMAYVGRGGDIRTVSVDTDTGGLELGGLTQDVISMDSLDVHPTGERVFTVSDIGRVNSWRVVGDLLEMINFEPTGSVPSGVVVSSSGRFLYITSHTNGIDVHRVDLPNGEVSTSIQTLAIRVLRDRSIVIHPSGRFAYAAGLQSIDDDTDLDGIFILGIDPETGLLLDPPPGFEPTSSPIVSLVISPSGRSLYSVNGEGRTVSVYAIDEMTGALTSVGLPIDVGGNAAGITLF